MTVIGSEPGPHAMLLAYQEKAHLWAHRARRWPFLKRIAAKHAAAVAAEKLRIEQYRRQSLAETAIAETHLIDKLEQQILRMPRTATADERRAAFDALDTHKAILAGILAKMRSAAGLEDLA